MCLDEFLIFGLSGDGACAGVVSTPSGAWRGARVLSRIVPAQDGRSTTPASLDLQSTNEFKSLQ